MYTEVTLESRDRHQLQLKFDGHCSKEDLNKKVTKKLNNMNYEHYGYIIINIEFKGNKNVK